jgi:hypothetical protein
VYASALTVALVPLDVVTAMLYVAAAWAGETAVIVVAETTLKLVAGTDPKATLVAPVNPLPVIVTVVPPAVGPEAGEMAVMAGGSAGALTIAVGAEAAGVPGPPVLVAVSVTITVCPTSGAVRV